MIEKLLDLAEKLWTLVTPIVVVHPWQGAGVMRLGLYHRTLGPGYHAKWPLLEDVVETETCETTMRLPPQSLMTKDGKDLVTTGTLRYQLVDVKPYVCDVYDQKDALADNAMGAIASVIRNRTLEQLQDEDGTSRAIIDLVRKRVNKYGFKILNVTLTDFSRARSFRLIQAGPKDLEN